MTFFSRSRREPRELLDELDHRSIASSLHPRTGNVSVFPVDPPMVIRSREFGPVTWRGDRRAGEETLGLLELFVPFDQLDVAAPDEGTPDAA